MPNDELHTLRAIVFIDAQAVHGMYLFGQGLVVSEQYRFYEFTLRIASMIFPFLTRRNFRCFSPTTR